MSLIELLVVMMILVIGIFTVATVFPQGFRFIEHARNVSLAGRLTQAEVERWKSYAENVPDGIEAEDPTTGNVWTDYNPDDLSNAATIPPGDSPWYWSNVNRTRLIKGEVTKIPTATVLPYGSGGNYAFSLYNLKFAPAEFVERGSQGHKLPPGYEWPDQYVLIYGDAMPRTDVTGLSGEELTNALETLDRQGYAIDYDKGMLHFQSLDWTRKYKVEYAYWDGPRLQSYVQVVTIAGGSDGSFQLDHGSIDQYSDRVSRKFEYVAPGEFDDRNPYQFTMLNGYQANTFAPTVAFNPIGANRTQRTNLGTRPLTAHIDYEVLDWHVIHEDRTIPNPYKVDPNGYLVRLTLPGIKAANRREADINAMYAGPDVHVNQVVYKGLTPSTPGLSVVALDMTDNTLLQDGTGPGRLIVNYNSGSVRVPAAVTKWTAFGGQLDNQDVRGHDLRFFYQATGDWAVQVSKAWSNYQRRDVGVGSLANLQYNSFDVELVAPGGSINQLGFTNGTKDWAAVLIFPRSNAGQTIGVSLIWYDKANVPHEMTGREDKLPEFGSLGTRFPYLALRIAPPSQFAPSSDANESWKNPYFTFVQGASLKVRTIWREDPRRWETRDMETFLNRK